MATESLGGGFRRWARYVVPLLLFIVIPAVVLLLLRLDLATEPGDSRTSVAQVTSAATNPQSDNSKGTDDQRAAAAMVVTLSGAVMTAALAVLAGQVTFAAFSFDKGRYESYTALRLGVLLVLNLLAVGCLVGSIVAGGQGIAVLYKAGFAGHWELRSSGNYFEVQTVLCLSGLLIVIALVVVGVSRPTDRRAAVLLRANASVRKLEARLHQLESDLRGHQENAERRLKELSERLKKIHGRRRR